MRVVIDRLLAIVASVMAISEKAYADAVNQWIMEDAPNIGHHVSETEFWTTQFPAMVLSATLSFIICRKFSLVTNISRLFNGYASFLERKTDFLSYWEILSYIRMALLFLMIVAPFFLLIVGYVELSYLKPIWLSTAYIGLFVGWFFALVCHMEF